MSLKCLRLVMAEGCTIFMGLPGAETAQQTLSRTHVFLLLAGGAASGRDFPLLTFVCGLVAF